MVLNKKKSDQGIAEPVYTYYFVQKYVTISVFYQLKETV